jgi:hypothetical protein
VIRRSIALALLLLAIGSVPSAQAQLVAGTACPNYVAINQTASATVISGIAKAQRIYICSIVLINNTPAQSISIVEGTGTVCATNILAIMGGTTASATVGMSMGVNGQLVSVASGPFISSSVTQNNLCILQSGVGVISGAITYVAQP